MKKSSLVFINLSVFLAICALSGCNKNDSPSNKSDVAKPSVAVADVKVGDWGPQSAKVGELPNKQPDGTIGLWIQVTGEQSLGEVQVLLGGQPAKATSIQDKLITVSISPDSLAQPGDKEVVIKQVSTGKIFPVGIFKVTPAQ